jgi:hypothetical protein
MRSVGLTIVLAVLVAGCASTRAPSGRWAATPGTGAPAKACFAPQYCISDGAAVTQRHQLPDDRKMLSTALGDVPADSRAGGTVVLLRRGPEGTTRELIPLDAAGRLADPSADRVLRDGDQIMVPTRESEPAGLDRPITARSAMN